jgi:hypothetical protein
VSNTDSFIEEVSEEVRRDKMFKLMRRYGWIGIAVVVLIVAGAGYNEWRKAQTIAAAQAFGNSVLDALSSDESAKRVEALQAIEVNGAAGAVLAMLQAAETQSDSDPVAAAELLQQIADDAEMPVVYRELATLKRTIIMGDRLSVDERRNLLLGVAVPGSSFRLLAEEQLALLDIESGDTQGAIPRLLAIISDSEITPGLRNRATQLIVALGGTLDAV